MFALTRSANAAGGDFDFGPLNLGQLPAGTAKVHIFGLIVSEDGSKFPSLLEPDYVDTNSWNKLDLREPMYIAWELEQFVTSGDCAPQSPPVKVIPPRPLSKEDWFATHYNNLIVHLVWSPPNVGGDFGASYVACPDCTVPNCNLEAPGGIGSNAGFEIDGSLRIADIFGGIGTLTQLVMWTADAAFPDVYILYVQWSRPATYRVYPSLADIDAFPGMILDIRRTVSFSTVSGPSCDYEFAIPQMTVEWPSADFPPTSPRFVDSADLAAFSAGYGSGNVPVVFGFDFQGGPAAANFKFNLNPFGTSSMLLDSGDISVMASHLGKHCGLTKAVEEENASTILDWFGIESTGRQVVYGPHGETIPEYDILDWEQNRRAQADPYGYQTRQSARPVRPWSDMKSFYR